MHGQQPHVMRLDVMSASIRNQVKAAVDPIRAFVAMQNSHLQRKRTCGNHAGAGIECAECSKTLGAAMELCFVRGFSQVQVRTGVRAVYGGL